MKSVGGAVQVGSRSLRKRWPNFCREEHGTVTIEFVLWMPIYIIILTLTVDTSLLFLGQAGLWSAAHDVSRQMAIGEMTEAEGVEYAEEKLEFWTDNPTVDVEIIDGRVEVEITAPANELAVFGFLGLASDLKVHARTIHILEPGTS